MSSGIEDKIIAYFEGGLTDAESAELLHLTSVSPEIRDIFREHEMLRDLAHVSMRSVSVSPEVESALFTKIESLAGQQTRKNAPLIFSRRSAALLALALMLISGSLGYLLPRMIGNGETVLSESSGKIHSLSSVSVPSSVLPDRPSTPIATRSGGGNPHSERIPSGSVKPDRILAGVVNNPGAATQVAEDVPLNTSSFGEGTPTAREENTVNAMSLVAPRIEAGTMEISSGHRSPFEALAISEMQSSRFELSMQTSSGFTYPADATPIKPFADQRLSLAFHFTENNLIGFRLGSGLYQQPGSVQHSQEGGIEILRRDIETKRNFSEEIFISHLIPIYFLSPFTLAFSVAGGMIPNGFTLGAEAGVRIPVSENFLFDVSFALSRVHSSAMTTQQILASETTSMQPILIESTDIHNTLNGRLNYGLAYRF